jgi:hypothetical protein
MAQKEYLSPRAKEYSQMSDTELIDKLTIEPSAIIQGSIKAILDKRTKKAIQSLTEVIQKNNEVTEEYNKRLIKLTHWLLGLTVVMSVATIVMTAIAIVSIMKN